MTDEDRYARRLGKKFESIRALARLPDGEDEFVERCAQYAAKQFAKEADIRELLSTAQVVLAGSQALFLENDPLECLRRTSADSLGAEHAYSALLETITKRDDLTAFLDRIASSSVESILHLAAIQKEYADDLDLCRLLRQRREDVQNKVASIFKARCDFAPAAPPLLRLPQEELLEFVVVRE